jgi:hypothetical protein
MERIIYTDGRPYTEDMLATLSTGTKMPVRKYPQGQDITVTSRKGKILYYGYDNIVADLVQHVFRAPLIPKNEMHADYLD